MAPLCPKAIRHGPGPPWVAADSSDSPTMDKPPGIDRRTNLGRGGGGSDRIDVDGRRSKRALKPDQAGDLRYLDRDALPDLRLDRQVDRFVLKVQRAADRSPEFLVSSAMLRSIRAMPSFSGSLPTAHSSSVDGSTR